MRPAPTHRCASPVRRALEGSDAALAPLLVAALLALIHECLRAGQHEIHPPGQLVSSGGVGPRPVHSRAQAAVEHPGRRADVRGIHRRHLQRLPSTVGRTLGTRRPYLAAADLRSGAQAQPRAEALDAGTAAHVGADLRQQLHHHRHAQPIHSGEINSGPVGQRLASVEFNPGLGSRLGRLARIDPCLAALVQQPARLGVALDQVLGDVVLHRQRLTQHEQVFLAPVARQRLGDLFGAGLGAGCGGVVPAPTDPAHRPRWRG